LKRPDLDPTAWFDGWLAESDHLALRLR
jgi:hypothetical protein